MATRNKILSESQFYCVKCGNKGIPIARKIGSEREAGHLKKIYCLNCKEQVNHVECKPFTSYDYQDFLFEFQYHNFDENGLRKMSYGDLKGAVRSGKIK